MSRGTKIAFFILALLFAGAVTFGLYINKIYDGFVASTNVGEPLFERELLESYGDQLVNELAGKNVKFAIVSRSGQPRENLPKGVMFTHSAFFVYAPSHADDGSERHDYAVYNLYHGEENRLKSTLVTDSPADFLRLLQEHDAGIIIPTPETQTALTAFLDSEAYDDVHQENYSLISNPLDTRFQNCNEFMLDTMAAFFWDEYDPAKIKVQFKKTLEPAKINASFMRRHVGPLVDERLIMRDQGKPILTTTSQTLSGFLKSENRLSKSYTFEFTGR